MCSNPPCTVSVAEVSTTRGLSQKPSRAAALTHQWCGLKNVWRFSVLKPRRADPAEPRSGAPPTMRRSIQYTMLLEFDSSRNSSSVRRRATRFFSPALRPRRSCLPSQLRAAAEWRGRRYTGRRSSPGSLHGLQRLAAVSRQRQPGEEHPRSIAELLGDAGNRPAPSLPRNCVSISRASSSNRRFEIESPK